MNIEEFWTLKWLSRRKGCWRSFSKNVELSLLSVANNRASPWLRHFGNFTVYFMPVQQSRFNCSKINYAWIYQITPCCGLCLKRGSYIISRLCFLGKVHYLLSLTNCSDNVLHDGMLWYPTLYRDRCKYLSVSSNEPLELNEDETAVPTVCSCIVIVRALETVSHVSNQYSHASPQT